MGPRAPHDREIFRSRLTVGRRQPRRPAAAAAAAKSIGMSYRRAWMLVDQINATLRQPAVASAKGGEHGGGSRLTAVGEDLIARYRRIETRAAEACADDMAALLE